MYQLKLHHKKEHPDEELIYHNCNICGKEFYSPFALASHVERIHENFKSENTSDFNEEGTLRFRCDFCNKTFSQHNSLKQHIMTAHEGIRHKCELCSKSFTTSDCSTASSMDSTRF